MVAGSAAERAQPDQRENLFFCRGCAPAIHAFRQRSSSGRTPSASSACSRCSMSGSSAPAPASGSEEYALSMFSMLCMAFRHARAAVLEPPAPARSRHANASAGAPGGCGAGRTACRVRRLRSAALRQRLFQDVEQEGAVARAAGLEVCGVRRRAGRAPALVQPRCAQQMLRRAKAHEALPGAECEGCRTPGRRAHPGGGSKHAVAVGEG